jgi:hypothetical protein
MPAEALAGSGGGCGARGTAARGLLDVGVHCKAGRAAVRGGRSGAAPGSLMTPAGHPRLRP